MDLERRRMKLLLLIAGFFVLNFIAGKCRELVGENTSSQSEKFTVLNCFDMSTGTLACTVKESMKLYSYNMRSVHVSKQKHRAMEGALADALSQGMSAKDAAKEAQKAGKKAANLATQQLNRVIGPMISSGWDFFEAIYFGGTPPEGVFRGAGTLFGTYAGGVLGGQRFKRMGYIVGSQLGSWIGGRFGQMVYDIYNGIYYLVHFR